MKLTKKLETEVLKTYYTIWDAYLKGDMRSFASILDENCHIIGSAAGEVFNNKKSAVKYYKATAGQITGKAELRNRRISVLPVDKDVMVNEHSDFYVWIDDQWTFYGHCRISSLFQKKQNKWKVIHQHGSFPDSKTEEGEQVNTEKIVAENLQLRDAVKRRTIELENKNRELEIEAAVERVRAKALAMHKSEEIINVVNALKNELGGLNIPGVVAATICLRQENGNIRLWDITSVVELLDGFQFSMDIIFHLDETEPNDWIRRIWDTDKKYFVVEQDKKSIQKTLAWNRRYNPQFAESAQRFLEANNINLLWHPAVPLSHGKLSLDLLQQPVASVEPILTKMGAAFDLAYKRFLDLKNAEAQTREAQIELALERVRARAMAMHHSDELNEVLPVLFDQFDILGIHPSHATISLIDPEKNLFTFRMTGKAGKRVMAEQVIPLDSLNLWKDTVEQLKNFSDVQVYSNEYSKAVLPKLWKLCSEIIAAIPEDSRPYPEDFPDGMHEAVGIYRLSGGTTYGTISFCHNRKATEEEKDIVGRFATEFGRLYQRFLDLQKAEAQAREAQIELGLERVRAGAMAMRNSDELGELVAILFEELIKLDLILARCIIWIFDSNTLAARVWMANSEDRKIADSYYIKRLEHSYYEAIIKGWKERNPKWVYDLSGEYKKSLDELLLNETELARLPEVVKSGIRSSGHSVISGSFNNFGLIEASGPVEQTEEQLEILSRFGKVFDLSYTRFNDLKQAEAQAREARIESALERVRSKAMAMQKSEDLANAVAIVFEELEKLNLGMLRCGIGILNKEKRSADVWTTTISDNDSVVQVSGDESMDIHPLLQGAFEAWLVQKDYSYILEGEDLNNYYKALTGVNFRLPESQSLITGAEGIKQYYLNAVFSSGGLFAFRDTEFPAEAKMVLKRFADVFNLTYTRFNDLKQAEAQVRESEIQLALERIRASTMAMHKSEEIQEVVNEVFKRLKELKIGLDTANILIFQKDAKDIEVWTASDFSYRTRFLVPVSATPHFPMIMETITSGKDLVTYKYDFEEKNKWFNFLFDHTEYKIISEERKKFILDSLLFTISAGISKNIGIQINSYSKDGFSEEENKILKRFTSVFEQSYTRFLDLQKAEAQAREAKIEAAMEKVRARALAMQKPEELIDVAQVLRAEMGLLGVEELETSSIYIHDEVSGATECWYAIQDIRGEDKKLVTDHMTIHLNETWVGKEMLKFYNSGQKQTSILMQGENRKEWINYCAEHSTIFQGGYYGETIPERTYHLLKFSNGYMGAASPGDISAESWELLKRATTVFSLAYTRFSDLQQAEAQAKEARIETSLERVRASAMAMHTSEGVVDATSIMFNELGKLGIETIRCGILIIQESQTMEVWSVSNVAGKKIIRGAGMFDMNAHPAWRQMYIEWKNKDEFFYYYMAGQEKEDYFNILKATPNYLSPEVQEFPDMHFQGYYFEEGAIWTFSLVRHSDEDKQVMKKFASVFGLTFRRYNDLKKAEAQARESQIEAALERVRASAMAMQNSEDVVSATSVLFSELYKLGIETMRCGILIIDEKQTMEVWTSVFTSDGQVTKIIGSLDMTIHPLLQGIFNSWKQSDEIFSYKLVGEDIHKYYSALANAYQPYSALAQNPDLPDHYCHVYFFEEGGLYTFSIDAHAEETRQVVKRFTAVFSLTFRRYQDLKKAEAQAREAIKASSLDRIRAEIASMRTAEDLQRITPSVWKELRTLGVPFFRCAVFIINEKEEKVHVYLSTPDGKPMAVLHLDFDTSDLTSNAVEYWRLQKVYTARWDREQFNAWVQTLIGKGHIQTASSYQGGDLAPESLTLQLVPFAQGMLYTGSAEPHSTSQIELVQALADAFSTAYARYEDFTKLENAKSRIEDALNELKATQTQLIQAEKMASLGELTAGIAHEIQNPLNFVNNFSEVNVELIEELKIQRSKVKSERDEMLEEELLTDISQNLEKITHHGKRADAIVKGMLQHSRTSSGQKEPTDINLLAEEYLRLAYHGLRAKDKSFNAKFETDFDTSIEKITVVPQELGRVLLNLINNAFYAVSEKNGSILRNAERHSEQPFEPTISLSTKKEGDHVLIRVKDNGNGIPQKVLDKIFQPFFTTKPTGQGTGLGLSLSYDIIKAHGGEIKSETKEGEGTTFIIQLNNQ